MNTGLRAIKQIINIIKIQERNIKILLEKKNPLFSFWFNALYENIIEHAKTIITLIESSMLWFVKERFTKKLEASNLVSIKEYVEEKNEPALILFACNKGKIEAKNTGKDIKKDLKIYFTFNLNAIKYIEKGATENNIFPGLIDNEKPNIKVINKISNNGTLWFLFKELIDLIAKEDIVTASKQLGAMESLLIAKVLVRYKLPKEDMAIDILVNGLADIFNRAKNK